MENPEFKVGDVIVAIDGFSFLEIKKVSPDTGAYCLVDVGESRDNKGVWFAMSRVEKKCVKVN